jgi:hypothetical protein
MDAYKETAAKAKKYKAGKLFGDYLEDIDVSTTKNPLYHKGFKKWCRDNPDHPLTKDYCLLHIFKFNMKHSIRDNKGVELYLSEEWVKECMEALRDGGDDADNVILELKNEGWDVETDALE